MTGLERFFDGRGRVALAFSGGVDSTYLLYAAVTMGADVVPYHVCTEFSRRGDRAFAERMGALIGARPEVIEISMLDDPAVAANPPDRCYLCKRRIFSEVLARSRADGCTVVIDGTNASDDESDRPGMRALRELGVESPLRLAGLTKDEIRRRSREAGLPTWDMPSNSCLATRVYTGVPLTVDLMRRAEAAEDGIKGLGFRDVRVRTDGTRARVQIRDRPAGRSAEVLSAVEPFFNDTAME